MTTFPKPRGNKIAQVLAFLFVFATRPRLILVILSAIRLDCRLNQDIRNAYLKREAERQDRLINPGKYAGR